MLRSEEIRNIITALGTGVGEEEYDIEKINYHKVIIMTDADVDGSHIRTLLLTFFYRQMQELIERGYLYIAQPPLLKVGKGKNEVYLKDETEFNDHILKRVCDNRVIRVNDQTTELKGHNLYLFLGNLSQYMVALERMERRGIPSKFIERLIGEGVEDRSFLEDKQQMVQLKETLLQDGYRVGEVIWNEERNAYNLEVFPSEQLQKTEEVSVSSAPSSRSIIIGRGFIYSKGYQDLVVIGKKILRYDHPPFEIGSRKKNDDEEPVIVADKQALLSHLVESGKRGLMVQRYKGLGEMNPDQLWETTMNPDKRNLLQVQIEDVVDTDEIFTVLMGEEVEPRREFIHNNALEVSMLDI